jgi:hypothetical protein
MILLDTNVLSELMRPTPEASVERWLADRPAVSVFTSAITEAELRYPILFTVDAGVTIFERWSQ